MKYLELINNLLTPKITRDELVIDLFSGCGGLSLGFEAYGFETFGYEISSPAVNTYNHNLSPNCIQQRLDLNYSYPSSKILIGGPPCQPFSVGGNQNGVNDTRNGFPIFIDAIKKMQPKIFLFENVRGLLYSNKWYFDQILAELQSLNYLIDFKILNSVDYGIPQNRERLVVVGHRSHFNFPLKQKVKVTVKEAIGDIMYNVSDKSKFLTPSQDKYIAKYEKASACINPRDLNPLKPSRTLTCRNLAGATGDMHRIKFMDGRRKRLTIREAARLQSFPDWFQFEGNDKDQFYQIGNAVPPLLAYQLAECVSDTFNRAEYSITEIKKINSNWSLKSA